MANHALLAALAGHIGREKGITAEALCARLGCTPRRLRALVEDARLDGVAVGAHPKHGYHICATAEELLETIAYLDGRCACSYAQLAILRKHPLLELAGQARLPT